MNISKASSQWASRPADERFWTLAEMLIRARGAKESSVEKQANNADLQVAVAGDEIVVVGRQNIPTKMTHWAFGQLCNAASASGVAPSAPYLRSLPADLAVANLKHGLDGPWKEGTSKLLIQAQGEDKGYLTRSFTSDQYARVWNADLIGRLMVLENDGWKVPPARPALDDTGEARPATKEEAALSLTIQEGDLIAPAGLYASDEDMFAFMVDPSRLIEDGTDQGSRRGFMMWNSEVGKSRYGFMSFLYQGVCGNHIIWGASQVQEITIVHRGERALGEVFNSVTVAMKKYAESSPSELENEIEYARERVIPGDKIEDVVNAIFKRIGRFGVSRSRLMDAYTIAEENEQAQNVRPNTVFGMVQGLTRLSQTLTNTDARMTIDRAAGKLMGMAHDF